MTWLSRRILFPRIQEHVSHDGSANYIAFCVSQIDTPNAQGRTNAKQAGTGKDAALAEGPEIVNLHFNRSDLALAPEVTVDGHSDRHIGHGSRDSSVSHAGAVGQFVAQSALDDDAIAMNPCEFHPE